MEYINNNCVNTKSINNFEFIRQKRFNDDNYNMNNQSRPYSIYEKTNYLFGNKLEDKIYDNSLLEQKENIDLFNNKNNIISKNNMKQTINQVNNKMNNIENNINKYNNNKFVYESNFEMNRIINNNIDSSNNKKLLKNKEYYFNYNNDESFNRLNEQNIHPINIKYNSVYKEEFTNYINNNDNFDYKTNVYINPNEHEKKIIDENFDLEKVKKNLGKFLEDEYMKKYFITPIKPKILFDCLFDSKYKPLIELKKNEDANKAINNLINESIEKKDDEYSNMEKIFENYSERIKKLENIYS
jgi:hypothetical protein